MLNSNVLAIEKELKIIESLSLDCEQANIEENDYTVYAYDELEYEYGLAKSSTAKKLGFLENQIVARNMTNLTPIQLEEFESVFRYFDKDVSNSLQELEFSAALASLGLVYDEEAMHDTFTKVSSGARTVSFEQFIRFMVEVTEDQNSADQVYQSFKEVADGKVSFFGRFRNAFHYAEHFNTHSHLHFSFYSLFLSSSLNIVYTNSNPFPSPSASTSLISAWPLSCIFFISNSKLIP